MAKITISCALALIAIIGCWFAAAHFVNKGAACDTYTLSGWITPQTFLDAKDCLVRSTAKNKTFLVTDSGGGSWESALALGILIHRHGWNVEVVDLCASSCANFIFPAGRAKYLHSDAMLLFHGGPHQHDILAQAMAIDQAPAGNSTPAEAKYPERAGMEGRLVIDDMGPLRLQVWEFLSVTDKSSAVAVFTQLINVSDQFYEELGVNLLLPHFGQIGRYEPIYQSYKYGGFMYRLDSLRRMGIGNIELKEGEWRPERNSAFPDVYEVTYP